MIASAKKSIPRSKNPLNPQRFLNLFSLMDQLREHPAEAPDAAFLEAVDVGLADTHGISGLSGSLLREIDRADDILLFGRESLHCLIDCRMQRFTVGTFEG